MGCDIHLHVEVKMGDKWEHYAAPNVARWYRLFGAMAGVRDESESPIVAPKGFPSDTSALTKAIREDYGIDGHTDSWLNHDEIMQLEDRLKEWATHRDEKEPWDRYDLESGILNTYMAGNGFTAHWRYDDMPYLPSGITDVRFVFWFDN